MFTHNVAAIPLAALGLLSPVVAARGHGVQQRQRGRQSLDAAPPERR